MMMCIENYVFCMHLNLIRCKRVISCHTSTLHYDFPQKNWNFYENDCDGNT